MNVIQLSNKNTNLSYNWFLKNDQQSNVSVFTLWSSIKLCKKVIKTLRIKDNHVTVEIF